MAETKAAAETSTSITPRPHRAHFGGGFGLAVNGEGTRLILFDVISFDAVKDEVG